MTFWWSKRGEAPACQPSSHFPHQRDAKIPPLFPAAAQQIAMPRAKSCNYSVCKGRLEVIPNILPKHLGRLWSTKRDEREQPLSPFCQRQRRLSPAVTAEVASGEVPAG